MIRSQESCIRYRWLSVTELAWHIRRSPYRCSVPPKAPLAVLPVTLAAPAWPKALGKSFQRLAPVISPMSPAENRCTDRRNHRMADRRRFARGAWRKPWWRGKQARQPVVIQYETFNALYGKPEQCVAGSGLHVQPRIMTIYICHHHDIRILWEFATDLLPKVCDLFHHPLQRRFRTSLARRSPLLHSKINRIHR